jgi:hypothetical protein
VLIRSGKLGEASTALAGPAKGDAPDRSSRDRDSTARQAQLLQFILRTTKAKPSKDNPTPLAPPQGWAAAVLSAAETLRDEVKEATTLALRHGKHREWPQVRKFLEKSRGHMEQLDCIVAVHPAPQAEGTDGPLPEAISAVFNEAAELHASAIETTISAMNGRGDELYRAALGYQNQMRPSPFGGWQPLNIVGLHNACVRELHEMKDIGGGLITHYNRAREKWTASESFTRHPGLALVFGNIPEERLGARVEKGRR